MTPQRRTQPERARATSGAVLRAAERLFGRDGFAATSLDDIAAQAGVTKGALYHHFRGGKADLFEAVVMRLQTGMTLAMDKAAASATGPDGLRRVLDAYFRIATEPAFHRITLLDAPAVLGPDRWRDIEHRHALRHIRDSVENILAATHIGAETKSMLAQAFFGAAFEATFAVVNASNRAAARRIAVGTLAAIVEGAYTVLLRPSAQSSKLS